MSTSHRSLVLLFLLASHLYVLAAPAGSGPSVLAVTETLLVIPSTLADAAPTSPPSTSAQVPTVAPSSIADGSQTLAATIQAVLTDYSAAQGPTLTPPSVFVQDSLATSTPSLPSADLQAASGVRSSPTTLYVPPQTASTSEAQMTPTTLFVSASSTSTESSPATDSVPIPSAVSPSVTPTSDISSATYSPVPHSTTMLASDPNPTTETEAASNWKSQQSRHAAILAAFLIIGVLTMFGVTYCCMRLKLPARLRRPRDGKKVRFGEDEVFNVPNEVYVPSIFEKDNKSSIVPDSAVFAYQEVTVPSLARQPTRLGPASAKNGVQADWRFLANYDGQFEDVTHILSTDVFAPLGRHERPSSRGSMSVLSGSRDSSPRTSDGGASYTGDSYKSCESHYSTPSMPRQSTDVREAPLPVPELEVELVTPNSPPSPAFPATPQAAHVEPGIPVGCVGSKEPHELVRGIRGSAVSAESEWDVAKAYGAHSSLGGDSLLSRVESVVFDGPMESVDVGGKKCMLIHG